MSLTGPTDRQIVPAERRRRRLATAGRWLVLLLLPLAGLAVALDTFAPRVDRDLLVLVTADRGDVAGGFQAAGRLVPRDERVVSAPIGTRVLAVRVEPGDRVEAGATLLELDLDETRLELARLRQRSQALDGELLRRRAVLERERNDLADRLETSRLDLELAEARLARSQRLHAAGLDPAERLREAEVEALRAQLAVRGTERALHTQQASSASELESLASAGELLAREAAVTATLLEQAAMRAERAGVVLEVAVQAGSAVAKGALLLRLAKLDAYEAEASAPASVAPRLAAGLPARLVLDAGATLAGAVAGVRPSIDAGAVHFTVALESPGHPDLRPNRRLDVWVITESRRDVVRLPARGLSLSGRVLPLWVLSDDRLLRRDVELGLIGPEHVEVVAGLAPGETVVATGLPADSPAEIRLKR